MKKNILQEVNRINQLMGTSLIMEATVINWLRKLEPIIQTFEKINLTKNIEKLSQYIDDLKILVNNNDQKGFINKLNQITDEFPELYDDFVTLLKNNINAIQLSEIKKFVIDSISEITKYKSSIKTQKQYDQIKSRWKSRIESDLDKTINNFGGFDDVKDTIIKDAMKEFDDQLARNFPEFSKPSLKLSEKLTEFLNSLWKKYFTKEKIIDLPNKVKDNLKKLNEPGISGEEILRLQKEIKSDMNKIYNWRRDLYDEIFAELQDQASKFPGTDSEKIFKKFESLSGVSKFKALDEVFTMTSFSKEWDIIKKSIREAISLERYVLNLKSRLKKLKEGVLSTIDRIFRDKKSSDPDEILTNIEKIEEKGHSYGKWILWGSSRGKPKKFIIKSDGSYVPNGYARIIENYGLSGAWRSYVYEIFMKWVKFYIYLLLARTLRDLYDYSTNWFGGLGLKEYEKNLKGSTQEMKCLELTKKMIKDNDLGGNKVTRIYDFLEKTVNSKNYEESAKIIPLCLIQKMEIVAKNNNYDDFVRFLSLAQLRSQDSEAGGSFVDALYEESLQSLKYLVTNTWENGVIGFLKTLPHPVNYLRSFIEEVAGPLWKSFDANDPSYMENLENLEKAAQNEFNKALEDSKKGGEAPTNSGPEITDDPSNETEPTPTPTPTPTQYTGGEGDD